jgi:hypothetical protein
MFTTTTNGAMIEVDTISAERGTAHLTIHKPSGATSRVELDQNDILEIGHSLMALRMDHLANQMEATHG